MESEDESSAYFKLFNDVAHNYLLHNQDDGLNDSYFAQIGSDWNSEVFPIFLSGNLITEEDNDIEIPSDNTQQPNEQDDNITQFEDSDNTLTFYTNVDQNGLILSNDVLLQIEENLSQEKNTVGELIDENAFSLTESQDSEEVEHEDNSQDIEMMQVLNVDDSLSNVDKDSLKTVESLKKVDHMEDFYSTVQAHKCKICSFLCENLEEMTSHINTKHAEEIHHDKILSPLPNRTFQDTNLIGTPVKSVLKSNEDVRKYVMYFCSECSSGYWNKENLKEHMVTQHKFTPSVNNTSDKDDNCSTKKTIEEPQSQKPEKNLRDLSVSLLRKQQNAKNIKCSIKGCFMKFAVDEHRQKHEECHIDRNKKGFHCLVCKEKFSIWRICNMHIWKKHNIDIGLLSCPICNQFKGNSEMRMQSHMAIHNEEKPFICSSCGKGFKQLNQLRNHEIVHKAPEDIPSWSTMKRCEFCERLFANSKSLKKHIKFVHDKFKPFICNICGHQTARKEMLQVHYRQHTGDKPHRCSYCDYRTGDPNSLRRHMMRHYGVAKYACPYCEYQSIQTSSYKSHLATKHPGKEGTYPCEICKYTTVNYRSYLTHVKLHELDQRKGIDNDKNNSSVITAQENEIKGNTTKEVSSIAEDDETQICFLNMEHLEDAVDTGGITIPAELDLGTVSHN